MHRNNQFHSNPAKSDTVPGQTSPKHSKIMIYSRNPRLFSVKAAARVAISQPRPKFLPRASPQPSPAARIQNQKFVNEASKSQHGRRGERSTREDRTEPDPRGEGHQCIRPVDTNTATTVSEPMAKNASIRAQTPTATARALEY